MNALYRKETIFGINSYSCRMFYKIFIRCQPIYKTMLFLFLFFPFILFHIRCLWYLYRIYVQFLSFLLKRLIDYLIKLSTLTIWTLFLMFQLCKINSLYIQNVNNNLSISYKELFGNNVHVILLSFFTIFVHIVSYFIF